MVGPGISGITILRLFRAFRVFRLFKRIPSLRKIIEGVFKSIPAVSQVFFILLIVTGIWCVLGVEFFADAEPVYFGNFLKALLTMTQIWTMDWATIARRLILDANMPLASLFFITYLFFAGVVMTNVVVAILLDKYLQATEPTPEEEQLQMDINSHVPTIYVCHDGMMKPLKKVPQEIWDTLAPYVEGVLLEHSREKPPAGGRPSVGESWNLAVPLSFHSISSSARLAPGSPRSPKEMLKRSPSSRRNLFIDAKSPDLEHWCFYHDSELSVMSDHMSELELAQIGPGRVRQSRTPTSTMS